VERKPLVWRAAKLVLVFDGWFGMPDTPIECDMERQRFGSAGLARSITLGMNL